MYTRETLPKEALVTHVAWVKPDVGPSQSSGEVRCAVPANLLLVKSDV